MFLGSTVFESKLGFASCKFSSFTFALADQNLPASVYCQETQYSHIFPQCYRLPCSQETFLGNMPSSSSCPTKITASLLRFDWPTKNLQTVGGTIKLECVLSDLQKNDWSEGHSNKVVGRLSMVNFLCVKVDFRHWFPHNPPRLYQIEWGLLRLCNIFSTVCKIRWTDLPSLGTIRWNIPWGTHEPCLLLIGILWWITHCSCKLQWGKRYDYVWSGVTPCGDSLTNPEGSTLAVIHLKILRGQPLRSFT